MIKKSSTLTHGAGSSTSHLRSASLTNELLKVKSQLSTTLMTNEQAVNHINSIYSGDSNTEAVAKLFMFEDIIELDVEQLLDAPLSGLLTSFIDHMDEVINMAIPAISIEFEDKEEAMKQLAWRIRDVLVIMQTYTDIYQSLHELKSQLNEQ